MGLVSSSTTKHLVSNYTSAMIEKVGQQTTENCLMTNYYDILLAFELHDDRFEPGNKVFV